VMARKETKKYFFSFCGIESEKKKNKHVLFKPVIHVHSFIH